ncbi:MAG: c-type cytochrome biogenesis protein CcmI [Paracoccaceae bacterium]|nr:c-type cytochrome biogenesis protein CcmI [Paracoccaceae bacterium]
MFWVAAGLMVAMVGAILLLGLRRSDAAGQTPAAEFDRRVYRDQLKEIERDRARGTIAEQEAQRLRSEVARRLLDVDRADAAPTARQPVLAFWPAALAIALMLGAAFWGYWTLGAPGYPDLPLKARIAIAEAERSARPPQAVTEATLPAVQNEPEDADFKALMTQLRAALATRPDDLQGQQLLVRNESNLGNFAAARRAQAKVIALKGGEATAEDYLLHARLMIAAADGRFSPEAEQALAEVLHRNGDNDAALFFMGINNLQVGRYDLTFNFWAKLLQTAPQDSPWRAEVQSRMVEIARAAGVNYTPPDAALPGPTGADMAAAADMTPEERQAMIRGMVEGLNARLASEGGSAQEWARLILALGQLGEPDRARAIWAEAQTRFETRAEDLAALREAAQRAGLTE